MATCYHPSKNPVNDPASRSCPVPPGQQHSMCCALNRDDPDHCTSGFNFLPPGFCLNPGDSVLYRDGCTDPDWGPDCVSVRSSGQGTDNNGDTIELNDNDYMMTACGDGTYCCGKLDEGVSCCSQGKGFYIVNNTQTYQKPVGLSNYGVNNTILTTTSATPAPAKNQDGAIAGGTVGGFIVGILLGFLIFFLYNRTTSRLHTRGTDEIARYEKVDQPIEAGGHQTVVAEAPGEERAAELGGSVPKTESRYA